MTTDQSGDRTATWIRLGTRLAVLAAILLLYHGIDTGSLIGSDDSIYTRAALEGARDGRLIDVTWMGHVLFEKGPLLFGGIQLSGLFGGPVEQQARFPGIVAGVLILLLIYRIGRDLGLSTPAAMVSAAFCLSTSLFYFNARRPMTDIPGLMLALAGFRTFLVAGNGRKHFLAGVMFGLSALFKLTAPVPFLAAAVALRLIRDLDPAARRAAVTGAAWCLAGVVLAVAPWHVAMTVVHGREFIDTYLGFHLFHRISQSVAGGGVADTYVGWVIARDPGASILLILAVPACILMAVRKDMAAIAALLLIIFAALPPAISSTALPHYIVPVLPGAALAAGLCADRLIRLSGEKKVLRATLVSGMVALMAIIFLTTNLNDLTRPDYSHDSKALCEIMMNDGSAAHIAGTFDLHDTAIPLYCDTEMKFYGFNPGYDAALRDIPMLEGTYVLFRQEMAGAMADTGEVLVCDSRGLAEIEDIARQAGLDATSRKFGTRYAVSFVRP